MAVFERNLCELGRVDRHIQIAEGVDYTVTDSEDRIARHPLMLREIKKQKSDLQLLERTQP
jgi:hypothetical protein